MSYADLHYRPNVGAVLFNKAGLVLVARRIDRTDKSKEAGWQLPQGGIDEDEDPRLAVFRELQEEIGTANAEILGAHPDWLTYDLPAHLVGKAFKGRYRGQRQRWFALRFLGVDADIRLDADPHPEFEAWKWVGLDMLPGLAVPFKRPIYEILARDFAIHAKPVEGAAP